MAAVAAAAPHAPPPAAARPGTSGGDGAGRAPTGTIASGRRSRWDRDADGQLDVVDYLGREVNFDANKDGRISAQERKAGQARIVSSSITRRKLMAFTPSSQYREVEAPSAALLRRAIAPPSPTLPRRPRTTGSLSTGPQLTSRRGGGVYEGAMLAGRPHGAGTLRVPSGRGRGHTRMSYEGEWAQGRRHGAGVATYRTGETFVGEFRDGLRHGVGRMRYRSGAVYDGGWSHGRRAGAGTLRHPNGDVFRGTWVDEKREGPGTHYRLSRGQKYVGEWVGDRVRCGTVVPIPFDELEELLEEAELAETGSLQGMDSAPPSPERAMTAAADIGRRRDALPRLKLAAPSGVVYTQVERMRATRSAQASRGARRGAKRPAAVGGGMAGTAVLGVTGRSVSVTGQATGAGALPEGDGDGSAEAAGGLPEGALERLRHAFMAMAGAGAAEVRVAQAPELLVLGGLDPTSLTIGRLAAELHRAARGTGVLSLDAFLQTITWFQQA